jgi:exodeoxyribonuclease VII large subunit
MRLAGLAQRLGRHSPSARLAGYAARLDGLSNRLRAGRDALLRAETLRVLRAAERIGDLDQRSRRAFAQGVMRRRDGLGSLWALMRSLGPDSVLARGYALVRDEAGALVRGVAQAHAGQGLSVQVSDGRFAVTVSGGGDAPPPRPARPLRKEAPKGGQGDLF